MNSNSEYCHTEGKELAGIISQFSYMSTESLNMLGTLHDQKAALEKEITVNKNAMSESEIKKRNLDLELKAKKD